MFPDSIKLGLCLGWKGQLICWREGRKGKGGWGERVGRGRREGGEGTWGREGGEGRGRGGEGRGGEGRGEGKDDCYTYSNRYVQ